LHRRHSREARARLLFLPFRCSRVTESDLGCPGGLYRRHTRGEPEQPPRPMCHVVDVGGTLGTRRKRPRPNRERRSALTHARTHARHSLHDITGSTYSIVLAMSVISVLSSPLPPDLTRAPPCVLSRSTVESRYPCTRHLHVRRAQGAHEQLPHFCLPISRLRLLCFSSLWTNNVRHSPKAPEQLPHIHW
jgi:hypothetical protein